MRIAFWLSDRGGSPLQSGLERGFKALGHNVEMHSASLSYDLIVMFNQTAHTVNYHYPEFPRCQSPIAFVDTAEYGYFKRLPHNVEGFKNSFTHSAMHHDTKNSAEQYQLAAFLQCREKFPYFLREKSLQVEYPHGYYPIDYPLYIHSECHVPPDKDEYLRRTLEVFCVWGASHPWRVNLTQELRDCHRTAEITLIGENGAQRIPQSHYFDRMRAARLCVSYDGYGYGSFRMMEALCRTVLAQGKLSVDRYAPLQAGVHCVEYDVNFEHETYLGSGLQDAVRWVCEHPEESFEVYRNGFEHVWRYYTEKAYAQYLLDTVAAHDWQRTTPLVW